jgi:hypothetical protein
MIYIIILTYLLILVLLFEISRIKVDNSVKNFFYYSSLFILIAVAGLRYRIGMDTFFYMYNYENTPVLKDFDFSKAVFEPFWYLLLSLCKSIVNDFVLVQIVHAIVVNTVIFWFIKKYTVYRFTAIFIYYISFYILFNTELLRQALSICCLLVAYPSFTDRKWLKYYMLSIVAVLFHYTALLFLIFPLLKRIRVDVKIILLLFAVSVLFLVFSEQIKNLLTGGLEMIGLSGRLDIYLNVKLNYKGIIGGYVLYVFIPAIVIYFNDKLNGQNNFKDLYFIYFVISFTVIVFPSLLRLREYMFIICMVYWINFILVISNWKFVRRLRQVVICCLFILYLIPDFLFFFRDQSDLVSGTKYYHRYIPYCSVFNPKKNPQREKLWRVYAGWENSDSKKK